MEEGEKFLGVVFEEVFESVGVFCSFRVGFSLVFLRGGRGRVAFFLFR